MTHGQKFIFEQFVSVFSLFTYTLIQVNLFKDIKYSELKIIIPQILICIHTIGELGIFCDVKLFTVKKYFVISRYSYSIHSDVMSSVVPTRSDGQHPGSIHTYRYIYYIYSILCLLSKTYFDSL